MPDCSQAKLRALYNENGFDEFLKTCVRLTIIPRRRLKPEDTFHAGLAEFKEGAKFLDPVTHHTVAVIFWYTDIVGVTSETIRSLRVGNFIYDAASRPDPPHIGPIQPPSS